MGQRWSTSISQRLAGTGLVLAVAGAGCGARSEPRAACVIPLEREEPAVVFALAYQSADSAPILLDGGSILGEQRIALATMLERLENAAAVGMFTYDPFQGRLTA